MPNKATKSTKPRLHKAERSSKPRKKESFVERVVTNTKALASIQRSKKEAKQAEHDRQSILLARSFDNAPDFRDGQPTDAFKARSAAAEVRKRRMSKK